MLSRFILLCCLLLSSISSVFAAQCLTVFPSGWRELAPANEQLINFPANASTATLTDGTTLPRGDNLYLNTTLANQDELFVGPVAGGETTARLFFRSAVDWQNVKINENGNPEDLIIIVDGSMQITGGNTVINAIIYVKGAMTVSGNPTINGAVTVLGNADSFTVSYNENSITNADFNGMCNNAQPLANYRFDECEYTGVGFEVIDQTGNFSATSHSAVTTFDAGKVERGADLSNEGHHFETSIALPTDFSVSTWFKKPTSNSDSRYFVLGAMQAGGDLLFIDRNQTWHWGVYNPSTGTARGAFSFDSLDNNWHHMALVYSGGQTQLYIDGVLVDTVNRVPEGTLKFIGTSFDGVNGNNPQGFRAPLDEFIIFDGKLSAAEILTLYTNQNAGNNYDGSSRAPINCNPFAAWWQFENDFLDSGSSNSYELTPINAPLFGFSNPGPANTIGTESTCSYASFDGSNYATIDDSSDFNFPNLTVSTWVYPTSYATGNDLRSLVSKDEHFEFHITGLGKLYWWWRTPNGTAHSLTSTTNIPLNTWTHVAVVYDSAGAQNMYINGVLEESANFIDGLANTPCDFYIGTDVGTGSSTVCGAVISDRNFIGHIDEVHIYDRALSANEIQADLNVVHSCNLFGVDHFEISHDGNGLTCLPEAITIKACADASCTTLNTDNADVQLSINGVLNQTVTVSGGSTNASFSFPSVGTATLSLDQTFECKNGGSTSCDVIFADAGFVLDINGLNDVESCDASKFLLIKAVKLSDNGVNCAPAFTGSQSLNFAFNYQNPNTGTKVPSLSGIDMLASGVSQNRSITFDGDGEASLPVKYDDAGELTFSVAEVNSSGVSSATLNKEFYPSQLAVATALSSIDSDGVVTQVAGGDFPINIIAQCQNGTVTGNYLPQTDATLQLSVQQKEPVANTGVLTVGNVVIAATDLDTTAWGNANQATVSFNGNYSEVGIINLAARDTDYLGNVINSAGYSSAGRFIPAYFDVDITNNSFEDTCTSGATGFTYIGQPFTYLNAPQLLITAKNNSGDTTKNYTQSGYQKLAVTNIDRTFPAADTTQDGTVNMTKMVISAVTVDGSFLTALNGELNYVFNDSDSFTYTKDTNSEVGPFTADYDVLINSIQDSDGVNAATSLDSNPPESHTVSPMGVNLRFGRWTIENTFGPETSDLPVPMALQYWDGSNFLPNTFDNACTPFDAANLIIDNTNINPGTTSASGSGTFANGATQSIILSAPGTPNQGGVPVIYVIPSMSWLLYDWNWDGVTAKDFSDNPSATATFGLFRGNDRIIYQREVHN